MKIKNWEKFQHYKNRKPPWIKLYRDLLNDPDWFNLDPKLCKLLMMLWLIASEDENGNLPTLHKLAFRLRVDEKRLAKQLQELNDWLMLDASDMLAGCLQGATPETEREAEKEREIERAIVEKNFIYFWSKYPRKIEKKKAKTKFTKLKPVNGLFDKIITALELDIDSEQWEDINFVPHPTTWLNRERWNDDDIQEVEPIKNEEKKIEYQQHLNEIKNLGKSIQ